MSHYAVLDLEMCRVPLDEITTPYEYEDELIQIGAILLNEKYETVDTFMTYVSAEYGSIDPFIENLTGISPDEIKDAPCCEDALNMFVNWLPEDAIIVCWSDNDEEQIKKELAIKNIHIPALEKYFETWTDCQRTFSKRTDADKVYNLTEALNIAGIVFEDGAHDALVDAKNTAKIFAKMQTEEVLILSPHYKKDDAPAHDAFNPFAALLKNYKVDQ